MRSIYFTAFAVLLAFPLVASATYNDARLTTDARFTVNGATLTIQGSVTDASQGNVASTTVDGNTFDVTLNANSSIIVQSADRRKFTTSDGTVTTIECRPGYSEARLSMATANSAIARVVTITVSSDTCDGVTSSSSNTGSGAPGTVSVGSGGGAASVYIPPSTQVAAPVVAAAPAGGAAAGGSAVFTGALRMGTESSDVRRLQQLLATDPEVYPRGIVSGYFGSLTRDAVRAFQAKYGIVSQGTEDSTGYGVVGPATRAKIVEVFAGAAPSAAPQAPSPSPAAQTVSPVFSIQVSFGASHGDIQRLQQLLNSDPTTRVAESGVGSPGSETNYFGSLTRDALRRFQCKYDIVCDGTPATTGYGVLGPQTRVKLGEVFGE